MPLIQLRIHASGRSVTELKLLYTPDTAWKGPKKREPLAPRIPSQTYERSYSALRLCTLSCEGRAPTSRGRPQGGERVGAETIDQPPGDGEAGSPSRSAEQRETVRRGLRILARMIARAHLRRLAARSAAAPRPPTEGEEGD